MSKSIDQLVQDCIIGFEGLYVQLEILDNRFIYKPEELVRFKEGRSRFTRWSRNAEAGSLDQRLQSNRRVKEQAIRVLSHIQRLLEDAYAIAVGNRVPWDQINDEDEENSQSEDETASLGNSPATEMDQILAHVADGIDNLSYLDAAFREPFINDRTKGETSPFEPFDVQHVQSKYPAVDKVIAERVGKAISARRQLFQGQGSTELSSEPPKSQTADEPTLETMTNQLDLEDLTYQGSEHEEVFDDEHSGTSYRASEDLRACQVLPLPQKAVDGRSFRCPFCHQATRVLSTKAWKKHVCRDLRPYLCLENNCSTPLHRYARRKDWMNHVLQEHWTIYVCPFGCSLRFNSRDECREHLWQKHGDGSESSEIEDLVQLSTVNKTEIPENTGCPLCKKRLRTMETYQTHVGKHQKQLALFAIPRGLTIAEESLFEPSTEAGIIGLDPTTNEAGTFKNEDLISLETDRKESGAPTIPGLDEHPVTSTSTFDYFSIGKWATDNRGGRTQSERENFAGSSSNQGRQRGGVSLWQCCNCDNGWFPLSLDSSCPVCQVPRCGRCIYS